MRRYLLAAASAFRSDNITIPQLADRGALTVKVKRLDGEGPGHMKQQSPTPPVHLPLLDFLHPRSIVVNPFIHSLLPRKSRSLKQARVSTRPLHQAAAVTLSGVYL